MSGWGKREWAARVLAATGAAGAWARFSPDRGRLTILAYHRILDMGDEDAFPFDPELVSATPGDFRWQMEEVLRAGSPITFARLAEALDGGTPLPSRPIIVTFDDGYHDNFTHALPLLKELGVPATVFLSTGYVGKRGTFWFDRVAQLIYRAPVMRLCLSTVAFEARLDGDVASRRTATDCILRILKEVPDIERRRALVEMEDSLGAHAQPEDDALSGALTWDEVREMARHGVEFGSQTVTHPVLTRVDDAMLADELTASRLAIEKELGQPVTAIAYPVGGPQAFDDRVVAASARAGYRFGVSYVSGVNTTLDDPYRLKRLHVERYTSRPYFQCLLAAPRMFG
jgi:peptidoglycan/xylan/chitin deacetylase (PgdA/CDA1 family)